MSLYDHVAVVAPGLSLDRRRALVAAARSRGASTSVDAELDAARRRLTEFDDELDDSVPSLESALRRVAVLEDDLVAERERVATARGRARASDDDSVGVEYRAAIRDLSELETDYAAAREALERARERAREVRDVRDRRLRLENRVGNLERAARDELVERVRPAVDAAVRDAPGSGATTFEEAGDVTAALALVRVGEVHAPVVLACRRFRDGPTAEEWLQAPVLRL